PLPASRGCEFDPRQCGAMTISYGCKALGRECAMTAKSGIILGACAALMVTVLLAAAAAQPFGPGFMGPGMMSGPGMMGPWMGRRGFGAMCNPGSSGFAEWRADRIAELVKLTDAQRGKFDEFKAASIKSAEVM